MTRSRKTDRGRRAASGGSPQDDGPASDDDVVLTEGESVDGGLEGDVLEGDVLEGEAIESDSLEGEDLEGEVLESDELGDDDPQGSEGAEGLARASADEGTGGSLARVDSLQAYMRQVQRHPLLSRTDEHDLAKRYVETGDVDAAATLVTANLRLVVKIAYEYRRAYRNMMDLIQEGNIGLMQAVKRYDPYRGVKLSSYAAWWIRAYMLRYMLNNWRMVKLGTTQAQRKLFFNLNKEKARLSAMGIEPSHAEIANRLNVAEKEVIEMDRRLSRGDASLDVPMGDGEGAGQPRVELMSSTSVGPDEATSSAEFGHLVRGELARFRTTLSDKDGLIFDRRMIAEDPLTLQELGDEFGVSRERVRQLESRISGKLRVFLKEALGDALEVES